MNKRFFILLAFLSFSINLCLSQSGLKEIILNKKNTLPSNWVNSIQDQSTWEFHKVVLVKRKRVKDYDALGNKGKVFVFESNRVEVTPYQYKVNKDEYSDLDIDYHSSNKTIVMRTDVQYGSRIRNQKTVYKVINLTETYLVLEEIKDTHCFDFSAGRMLTKKECEERNRRESKAIFRGRSINIGFGKPWKQRLVFKAKK